jgi:murein DD-endopeptidase MepM/ murein hydrolase activator NlpD
MGMTLPVILLIFQLIPSLLGASPDPASRWNLLYPKVRDGLAARGEAQEEMRQLEILLKGEYARAENREEEERFFFPLRGYTPHSIGGKRGDGYRPGGFDFFDGNRHKGHPGHDIFIHDQDQDGLDDRTGLPVEVLSVSSGIVVSVHAGWQPGSRIRGGDCVWVFEPDKGRYYYYAHLNQVFVRVGQRISAGERLGTVGRTGLNAYPKRSPTHLHFSVFHSVGGYPKPIDPYPELVRACLR